MSDAILVDNDIVLKTCCYGAVDELMGCFEAVGRKAHILGVARFVLAQAIVKRKSIVNREQASHELQRLLGSVSEIEPTSEELALAAQFESEAQKSPELEFHIGESQLLAILILRAAHLLATGDKRAIRAMEVVVNLVGQNENVAKRIACFEQVVMSIIGQHGAEALHARICSEPTVDIAMSICFRCASGDCTTEATTSALTSYIRDMRRQAPNLLLESDDISPVIS